MAEIRENPDHAARRALDDLLAQLAEDLQTDPDTIAHIQGRMRGEVLVANYMMANEIPSYDVRASLTSVTVRVRIMSRPRIA